MTPSRNRQIAVAAVAGVAAIAAGASFAATKLHSSRAAVSPALTLGKMYVSSGGTSTQPRFDGNHGPGGPGGHGDELAPAATYLGLTQAELMTQLQSGKTLAQIADATSGKSPAGLIDALVAAEQVELDAAVKAGRITQAQEDQIVPTLKARFTDLVNNTRPDHGPGGPGFGHGHGPGGDDFAAAASYLGLTPAQLITQLQSGKTLAQVADATSGKSAAGLVDALVAAETTELDAALKAGTITQAQHDQIVAGLKARFTAMANGIRPDGPGPGPGGPGAPPRYANAPQNAPRI